MNRNRIILIIAAVLALGTGLLMFNYLSSVNRQAQSSPPRTVVVAAEAIPARVKITAAMLTTATRPADSVDPDALTAPQAAVGTIALIDIPMGSPVTNSKISHGPVNALPVALHAGMRAVSISVDLVKGVSGLLQAGDRVDVIEIPPLGDTGKPEAATILRGLRVLAVGTQLETTTATPAPNAAPARTVTLEVTPHQADLLAAADVNTTLRLALRAPSESVGSLPVEAMLFPAKATPIPRVNTPTAQVAKSLHPGVLVVDADTLEK